MDLVIPRYNPQNDEKQCLIQRLPANAGETVVYKRRWYILTVYCCVCALQGVLYNTWGPIQDTARAVYRWDDYVIDLIAAWGCIAFCLTMVPFAWLMDVKG